MFTQPLIQAQIKKTPKLRVTGLSMGNSPVTGEFPAQMASDAENVSIWWRHHDQTWNRGDISIEIYIIRLHYPMQRSTLIDENFLETLFKCAKNPAIYFPCISMYVSRRCTLWYYGMETLLCCENTGRFPSLFSLNILLSKQSVYRCFGTPWRSYDVPVIRCTDVIAVPNHQSVHISMG